jgi:DNA-binding GntR family transcriptional regulator
MPATVYKQQAYAELKRRLINCEYPPGSCINEAILVEDLGFSRTPIREALALIEQEGFVRIMPKKGVFVTGISLNDVKQIFQTRKEIEPITLRLAAQNLPSKELAEFHSRFIEKTPDIRSGLHLDMAMHLFIIEHCGNRHIIEMMHRVFEENTRIIISSKQNEIEIHDARAEHAEILQLLLAGKTENAAASMLEHLRHCERAALEFFYNNVSFNSTPDFSYKATLDLIRN